MKHKATTTGQRIDRTRLRRKLRFKYTRKGTLIVRTVKIQDKIVDVHSVYDILDERTTEMNDPTEQIRRTMTARINSVVGSREHLENLHGQVWDTSRLQQEFKVLGFFAPMITAIRKSDNKKGTLIFQHDPRFYFSFEEEA